MPESTQELAHPGRSGTPPPPYTTPTNPRRSPQGPPNYTPRVSLSVPSPSPQESDASTLADSPDPPRRAVSALHPQLAVILNVPKRWHIWLQALRWLSIGPAVFWDFYCAWALLKGMKTHYANGRPISSWGFEERMWFTEITLAMLWCSSSAYISFFFIDCLMSRWLLHYPIGSALFRLATMDLLNMFLTHQFIELCGARTNSPRLFVAWICIASTLTLLYHITHRRTNIKRETTAAVRVFSPLAFLSLCLILLQYHWPTASNTIAGSPDAVPFFVSIRRVGQWIGDMTREL
ncbi:uncharacterized protein BDZ99DRAFT_454260 [Mytilinidion resinicola]|uniref:N-glycosylation protein EOS1 n=1 Tax=Mytilinidion resinicola TaxID=574789 RepID=A0A6A6Y365_9PEZI|nr:uncharacterized protein BDZ99DRAFT_454260 [Mytilinidion resinicola]KAF2802968.1 hypothetical protein BDZ99DRAFT_454260 [Mytilinidion resinicola]